MRSITNGLVFYKGEFHEDLVVVYDKTIEGIMTIEAYDNYQETHKLLESHDAKGRYVLPGLIDVHIHGYKGRDTMDGNVESLREIASMITENGVTAFLPTTMTMPMEAIHQALESVAAVSKDEDLQGAMVLGAHLEGPFINESKKGAQPGDYIRLPDAKLVERYKDVIKIITIAPELEGAMALIDAYKDEINFSIGHTEATFEEACKAYKHGAKGTTHLFNAMTGLHHRAPGVVGAALSCDCYAEVIADDFHLDKGLYNMVIKSKGADRLLLITDCMRAGGLGEGLYELGGQKVTMKNGQCTLDSGTIAGSVLKLNEGLRNFTQAAGRDLAETLVMATLNQAQYLGLEPLMGSLEVGKLANILIMDDAFNIEATIVKGNKVYENQL